MSSRAKLLHLHCMSHHNRLSSHSANTAAPVLDVTPQSELITFVLKSPLQLLTLLHLQCTLHYSEASLHPAGCTKVKPRYIQQHAWNAACHTAIGIHYIQQHACNTARYGRIANHYVQQTLLHLYRMSRFAMSTRIFQQHAMEHRKSMQDATSSQGAYEATTASLQRLQYRLSSH